MIEWYCFLIINIDVMGVRVRDVFHWTLLHSYQKRTLRLDETASRRNELLCVRSGRVPTTDSIPLGVIRFRPRSPPLLIVSQHAGGSWLASVEDSGYKNIARRLVLSQKLALIRLEVSIGTGK